MVEGKNPTKSEPGPLSANKSNYGRNKTNSTFNKNNRRKTNFMPKQGKFEGKTEDIKTDIYDTPDGRHADLFNKATNAIVEYIQHTYTNGGMACSIAVRAMTKATFSLPKDPRANASTVDKAIFDEEIKQNVKERRVYKNSMSNIYGIILGQCTDSMVAAVESHKDFDTFSRTADALGLLKAIKEILHASESHRYEPLQLYEMKRRFFTTYQKKRVTCQAYFEEFKMQLDIIEGLGGSVIGNDLTNWTLQQFKIDHNTATNDQVATAKEKGQEAFIAVAFISGSDRTRYGKMMEELEHDQIKNIDSFPKTLVDAYNFLTRWKNDTWHNRVEPANDGVNFATTQQQEGASSGLNNKISNISTTVRRKLLRRRQVLPWIHLLKATSPSAPPVDRTNISLRHVLRRTVRTRATMTTILMTTKTRRRRKKGKGHYSVVHQWSGNAQWGCQELRA